jgi:hypothetical protein
VTVDPFAGDGPVEDASAASKRGEADTERLVAVLDDFLDVVRQRRRDPTTLPWHLGQDAAVVNDALVHDNAALLLSKVASWCQACVGTAKVMSGISGGSVHRQTMSDGEVRGDPDVLLRDASKRAPYDDQQRELDLLLSIWQVRVHVCEYICICVYPCVRVCLCVLP